MRPIYVLDQINLGADQRPQIARKFSTLEVAREQ
jgi:hypothetical protein